MSDKVKLRGTFDGIKIYIDKNASAADAAAELNDKLSAQRKFFGDAECSVYIISQNLLTVSDRVRLEAVISAHMPKSMVHYGEPTFSPPKRAHIHEDTHMQENPSVETADTKTQAAPEPQPENIPQEKQPQDTQSPPEAPSEGKPDDTEEAPEPSPIEKILKKWDDERHAARDNADRIVQKWDDEYRSAHEKTERIVQKWDEEREKKK